MAVILTDTCVLIEYFKENPEVEKEINYIGPGSIMLNTIIVMDFRFIPGIKLYNYTP